MTVGGSPHVLQDRLPALAALVGEPSGGAVALGFHIEGPWLNWDAWVQWGARPKGSRESFPPDVDDFRRVFDAARGHVKLVSCSPEFPGALTFIEAIAAAGVIPSIGHTTASAELVLDAVRAGVRHATHTFNGMQPMHHRSPGAAAAVCTDPRVVCELIADGAHVHPVFQQLLFRCKRAHGIALVTDLTQYGGLPPGRYWDDERQIAIEVRGDMGCWTESGNLSGSGSPIDRNLAVITTAGGVPVGDAVRMASTVPATELGLQTRKGRLAPGFDADVAAFGAVAGATLGGPLPDRPGSDLRCLLTMVAGEVVFRRDTATMERLAEEDAALVARHRHRAA
jgi:N-acetylglucosamine-6-phosphate deacetylase